MSSHKYIYALAIALLYFHSASLSQCCSAGSPVGASTNVGVAEKNQVKLNIFYRYSSHQDYFEGSEKRKDFGNIDYTYFNYTGLLLGYGLSHKTTIEADAGYFINKSQIYRFPSGYILNGNGMSSGTVSVKRALYADVVNHWEITIGTGIRFPFSFERKYYNNVLLPAEIQPSTGAFGGILHLFSSKSWCDNERKLFTYNRFEYNTENKFHYRYGWSIMNSLFYSHKIIKNLIFASELRNEIKHFDERNGLQAINTGSHVIVFSPRIIYNIAGKWAISVLYDTPLYRNYQGRQMGLYQSIAVNLSHQFSLREK